MDAAEGHRLVEAPQQPRLGDLEDARARGGQVGEADERPGGGGPAVGVAARGQVAGQLGPAQVMQGLRVHFRAGRVLAWQGAARADAGLALRPQAPYDPRMPARAALLLLALLGGCPPAGTGPGAGRPVELVLPALDGGDVVFASYRGHPVVVQFFTTWSLASQADQDQLRAARAACPDAVLVGVGIDPDGYALIAPWRDAAGVDWMIGLPTPQLAEGATPFGRITVVPTTVVLDRHGQVAYRHEGPLPRGELVRVVRSLETRGGGS